MEKRRTFTPKEKAKIVLEMLREEKTVAQIAAEYEVHPTQLHRWKAEAVENLPGLFTRGASEAEKMRRQHEAEKEELTKQIGQLTIEVNWLKKNLLNSTCDVERREDEEDKDIELMHRIDEIYSRRPHYVYRRIRAVLKDLGYIVNKSGCFG